MSKSTWAAPAIRPMPSDPDSALAHLVTHHGWSVQAPHIEMIQAHRFAHGVDGRPDLADTHLSHAHFQPTRSKQRPLTWVIIGWNILMFAWIVYGIGATGSQYGDCATEAYTDACQAGTSIGAAVAIGGILFLTAVVDVILGVIWVVTKKDAAR